MGFYFANPWGLLALGGIAVVVLLHFLRRKSRQVTVSTLFLVQRLMPSSEGGKRIRKFRNTLPFWVQLLTVLALALLLAQPRWIDARSSQTVVAIFDGSASMSAFRKEALAAAAVELKRREPNAAKTQWIVLRSDGIRLAAGSRLSDVLAQTERAWQPALGVHDLAEAKRLARALAGPNGSVVYFTDHPPAEEEAAGVFWVAFGEPIENAGFLAAGINNDRWTALLKNFGRSTREVRWRISGEADWRIQRLEPGQVVELSGEFPTGTDRMMLELEGDRFGFDDRVPLIKPQVKPWQSAPPTTRNFAPFSAGFFAWRSLWRTPLVARQIFRSRCPIRSAQAPFPVRLSSLQRIPASPGNCCPGPSCRRIIP